MLLIVSEKTKPKLEWMLGIYQKNVEFAMERMASEKPLTEQHRWLYRRLVENFHGLRRKLIVRAVKAGHPRKEVAKFFGVSLSQISYAVRNSK